MKTLALLQRMILLVVVFFVVSTERGCSPIVRLTPAAEGGAAAVPTTVAQVTAAPAPAATVEPVPTDRPQLVATPAPPVEPIAPPTATPTATPTAGPALPIGEWQPLLDLPRSINVFVVDPSNPQIVYAGTGENGSGSGVYKSADGGATWQLAAEGLPTADVKALAINPANPNQLYAMVDVRGEVYGSSDAGATWKRLAETQLFGGFERALFTSAADQRLVLSLARPGGLARSRDGGRTWTPLRKGLPGDEHEVYVMSLAIDPTDANVMYAGTGGFVGQGHGVYKSTDGGDSWSASNRGMIDYRITAIAIDPTAANIVYAGSDAGELFKSEDGGQTWRNLTAQLPLDPNAHITLQQIVFDPGDPARLYLLTPNAGLLIGSQGGAQWQVMQVPSESGSAVIKTMIVVPGPALHLLVGLERQGGVHYIAASSD
jgi:photosystem II stability/assembly factor-like uncharacterized protein